MITCPLPPRCQPLSVVHRAAGRPPGAEGMRRPRAPHPRPAARWRARRCFTHCQAPGRGAPGSPLQPLLQYFVACPAAARCPRGESGRTRVFLRSHPAPPCRQCFFGELLAFGRRPAALPRCKRPFHRRGRRARGFNPAGFGDGRTFRPFLSVVWGKGPPLPPRPPNSCLPRGLTGRPACRTRCVMIPHTMGRIPHTPDRFVSEARCMHPRMCIPPYEYAAGAGWLAPPAVPSPSSLCMYRPALGPSNHLMLGARLQPLHRFVLVIPLHALAPDGIDRSSFHVFPCERPEEAAGRDEKVPRSCPSPSAQTGLRSPALPAPLFTPSKTPSNETAQVLVPPSDPSGPLQGIRRRSRESPHTQTRKCQAAACALGSFA